ncbi:MAG: hypothetical protein P4L71_01480 [Acetobacteraceae bacterium]|nr:hypothetical protein [Acetobacteraceae bacterium]
MSWTASLWLLAAALSMLLGLELQQAAIRAYPTTDAALAPQSPLAVKRNDTPAGLRMKALAELVRTSLARPLFVASRTPFSVTAAPQPVATMPRLTGVIVASDAHLALFAPPEGKVIVVAEGGSVGDYLIRSISVNQVVLSGPGGEHALRTGLRQVTPHVIHAQQEASAR